MSNDKPSLADKELWTTLASLREGIDNIKETLTEVKKQHHEDAEDIKKRQDKTNSRVGTLEKWKAWILGFCACISLFLLPIVYQIVSQYISTRL